MAENNEIIVELDSYKSKRQNKHYDFEDIYYYALNKRYPDSIKDKGQKANFRRAAAAFSTRDGQLIYKKKEDGDVDKEVSFLILSHDVMMK